MDTITVKRAIKGDAEAYGCLIKGIEDQAYKIAYCYLNNRDDAMDCVCASVERAYRKIHQLKKPQYFKTWFIRIVINECKQVLKMRQRFTPITEGIKLKQVDTLPDLDLQCMIAGLPTTEKAIVYMKYYSGYTLDEIATILSLPSGTVRSKLYRTLKRMRKELENA